MRAIEPREIMVLSALENYLVTEIPGLSNNNPEIIRFFTEIGQRWVHTDETAWCSAFINYLAKINNIEMSGKLNARSWLRVGEDIFEPEVGDIVVFWREHPVNSWKGHVGLFIAQEDDFIHCLGGNQSNQVNITKYPEHRVLGFRRLHYV